MNHELGEIQYSIYLREVIDPKPHSLNPMANGEFCYGRCSRAAIVSYLKLVKGFYLLVYRVWGLGPVVSRA